MKTSLPLVLLLLVLLQAAAAPPPAQGVQAKRASWDDVNVVAHGLLQLGQGLKEHVDKTKAQMREVDGKLKVFNGTVAELERRQREQGESLAARLQELEDRERSLEELAQEVRAKVEEAKGRSDGFLVRMETAEEKVEGNNNSDEGGVPFLQRLLSSQNRRIDQLVDKIKQQQDKLEKQSLHLQAMQRKVAHKRVKSHRRRDDETALTGEPAGSAQTAAVARDCQDLFARGQRASGVYTVQPQGSKPFNVFCEMTKEGGWTVIQKRYDGSQDFDQLWESYKSGFGDLNGEFWLGLEHVHALATQGPHLLQVELSDGHRQPHVAAYSFQLAGEEQRFALRLQDESSAQERLLSTAASGLPFSTADRDSDSAADVNCAQQLSGGWWFSSCGQSNLNGRYPRRPSSATRLHLRRRGMFWTSSAGQNYSIRTSVLKIAPATIKQ